MKKKITTIVLLLAFAAIAVTGGTLAYFTDTKEATNTFTMGNVTIKLDEVTVDPNTWEKGYTRTEGGNTYNNLYPGAIVPKDPTIHNMGSNAAYVRLKLTVAENVLEQYKTTSATSYEDIFPILINGPLQNDWDCTKVEIIPDGTANNVVYTITYQNVLVPHAKATAFTEICFPKWITDSIGTTFEIGVKAEAIQADGFTDVTDAFTAFDAQV